MIFTSSIVSSGIELDCAAVGSTLRSDQGRNATRTVLRRRLPKVMPRRTPLRDRRCFSKLLIRMSAAKTIEWSGGRPPEKAGSNLPRLDLACAAIPGRLDRTQCRQRDLQNWGD